MKENLSLRFLYRTVPGRVILKILTLPPISRAVGRLLDSRISVCLIPYFIRKYHISTRRVVVPEGGFRSFNQFFCRREVRKRNAREESLRKGKRVSPVQEGSGRSGNGSGGYALGGNGPDGRCLQGSLPRWDGDGLLSPCDGYLSRIPIRKNEIFDIKHTKFTLEELLQNPRLAREFQDGCACIFRLTPADYHRYCFAVDGKVLFQKKIPGRLHCVRPIATGTVPVYAQNAREYQVIETQLFGRVVQMEVGALMIGRITNLPLGESGEVKAGEEKGYFEFGGSTIVVLLKKGILEGSNESEIPVRRGDIILG